MKKRYIAILSFLSLLCSFYILIPSIAIDWGTPLATDPAGDVTDPGEDILWVDAAYENEFAYFRFKMNSNLTMYMAYSVNVDYDKNVTTGYKISNSDIGADFYLQCIIIGWPEVYAEITLSISGFSTMWVRYNMTANNGTVMSWSDPDIVPYIVLTTFINSSQGDLAFGVDWTFLTFEMLLDGISGDGSSVYLEFLVGGLTDWCPDRTAGTTDYIVWTVFTRNIPSFPIILILACLLILVTVRTLLDRRQVKF